jgi:hypothetical protein
MGHLVQLGYENGGGIWPRQLQPSIENERAQWAKIQNFGGEKSYKRTRYKTEKQTAGAFNTDFKFFPQVMGIEGARD